MVETTQIISKFLSRTQVTSKIRREFFAVAPMVDVSDKYFLYLMRLMSKRSILYTQMLNENAILNNKNLDRLFGFMPEQRPIVC
jgi:tRNA-dihydrouridine synthase A